ncbi:hypothetical protein [Agromyces archimandritae]|uniref:Uncharacterized protein n=1 Tax=Agromyces archimandritae TaxID=2781962 RepID=A0A975IQQ8_9MICO|nr:hypothetical protein [Agromyces archimandritae]QTX05301.1 hypothetical protein G127AT_03475 [Agromyces archimandritae]
MTAKLGAALVWPRGVLAMAVLSVALGGFAAQAALLVPPSSAGPILLLDEIAGVLRAPNVLAFVWVPYVLWTSLIDLGAADTPPALLRYGSHVQRLLRLGVLRGIARLGAGLGIGLIAMAAVLILLHTGGVTLASTGAFEACMQHAIGWLGGALVTRCALLCVLSLSHRAWLSITVGIATFITVMLATLGDGTDLLGTAIAHLFGQSPPQADALTIASTAAILSSILLAVLFLSLTIDIRDRVKAIT